MMRLTPRPTRTEARFPYTTLFRSWCKGHATEAGTAAIDWAFEHLGWDDIIHCIDPGNAASQRVAQRLGSRNRGPGRMPPPYEDHPVDVWGQTRAEWVARRAGAPA